MSKQPSWLMIQSLCTKSMPSTRNLLFTLTGDYLNRNQIQILKDEIPINLLQLPRPWLDGSSARNFGQPPRWQHITDLQSLHQSNCEERLGVCWNHLRPKVLNCANFYCVLSISYSFNSFWEYRGLNGKSYEKKIGNDK
jgi:hypothetical protein